MGSTAPPRREALLDGLQRLGFDARGSAVYLFLLTEGPCKASDVAASLRMPRGVAYQALNDLAASGHASAILGRPLRYAAAPPERLLDEVEAAQRDKLEAVQHARTELGAALAQLPRGCSAPARATFRVLEGRSEIRRALERMLRGAQRAVKVVNTHESSVALGDLAPVRDLAAAWAARGVTSRVLTGAPPLHGKLAALPVEARDFPGCAAGSLQRFVVVDQREALLWTVNDASPRPTADDVAVWSDAGGLVLTLDALFEAVWSVAQPPTTGPANGYVPLAAGKAPRVAGLASSHDGLAD